VDVNFLFLKSSLTGSNILLEEQKSYAERILGEQLYYTELEQLYYLNTREITRCRSKLRKYSYPKDFPKTSQESDEYKHLRVFKN
jgi:hypothetical protein